MLLDVENSELAAVSDVWAAFGSGDLVPGLDLAESDLVADWIRSSNIGRALVEYAASFIEEHTAEVKAGRLLTLANDLAGSALRYSILHDFPKEGAGEDRGEVKFCVDVVLVPFEKM